jgi:hypothetical protein
MKKNKIIKLVIVCFVLLSTLTVVSFKTYHTTKEDASIVGTWISEEDTNWKMVFTTSRCKWFYENVQTEEFNYLLSNTTPQCGETVSITAHTGYLQITNVTDTNDKDCYEIYGLTDEILTLRPFGRGGFLIFHRQ